MVSSRQVLSSLLVASLALATAQGPGMSEDGFIAQSGSMDEPSGPPSGSMAGEPMEEDLATVEPTSEGSLTVTEAVTIPPVPIGPLCSVYPLCKASDLEGNCCPSDNGEMLSCCMGVLDEDEDFEVDDEDEAGDEGPAMTTGSVGGMDTPVNITVGEVTYYDMNETLSEDLSEDLLDEDLGPPTVAPTTTYAPTEMGTTGAPTDTFQPTWGGSTYAPTKMPGAAAMNPASIPFTSSEDTTAAETDSDADAVATPSSAARISMSLVTVAVGLGALFLC